jgi:hypothetical protein
LNFVIYFYYFSFNKIQITFYNSSIIFVTIDTIDVEIVPNGRYGLYLSNDYKSYAVGWIVGVVVGDIYHIYNWLLCDKK